MVLEMVEDLSRIWRSAGEVIFLGTNASSSQPSKSYRRIRLYIFMPRTLVECLSFRLLRDIEDRTMNVKRAHRAFRNECNII